MATEAKDATMATESEIETLDITVERGKSGGFGIAIMAGSNGGAYVERVQDKAKEQIDILKADKGEICSDDEPAPADAS